MFQVTITKSGVISNQASFDSLELAQAWVEKHTREGNFGPIPDTFTYVDSLVCPEFSTTTLELISPAEFDQDENEIEPAMYKNVTVVTPAVYTKVPVADFQIEYKDLTAELTQEAANKEAKAFLDSTDWKVIRAMERGESLSPEFKAQRDAARAAIIK
jgi:hypothetical protein